MAAPSPRRESGPRSAGHEAEATRRAAATLGLSPLVLGQDVRQRGIHVRTAALIREAAATGNDRLFAVLTTEIVAAMDRRPRLPLQQILMDAQTVDLREDLAEQTYLLNPTDPQSLRTHLALLRQQWVTTLDLIRAMETRLQEMAA